MVPFFDEGRGGGCGESIAFVIGIHFPESRIIETRAANKKAASIFIERGEDKARKTIVKGTDSAMRRQGVGRWGRGKVGSREIK